MEIGMLTVGPVATNCYVINKEGSSDCLVIDPGEEAGKIYNFIEKRGLKCQGILLTHGHFDHIGGVAELAALTGAKVYAYEGEKDLMMDPVMNGGAMWGFDVAVEPEILFRDKQNLDLAGLSLQVIHTPGHTRGGVCFYSKEDKALFCGDTLFCESVGRTDLPTGNMREILESLREVLLKLPGDVVAYPGHGPETTIEYERANNPYA